MKKIFVAFMVLVMFLLVSSVPSAEVSFPDTLKKLKKQARVKTLQAENIS